jgi:hypothetical protein
MCNCSLFHSLHWLGTTDSPRQQHWRHPPLWRSHFNILTLLTTEYFQSRQPPRWSQTQQHYIPHAATSAFTDPSIFSEVQHYSQVDDHLSSFHKYALLEFSRRWRGMKIQSYVHVVFPTDYAGLWGENSKQGTRAFRQCEYLWEYLVRFYMNCLGLSLICYCQLLTYICF